jgi:hypothetical protein
MLEIILIMVIAYCLHVRTGRDLSDNNISADDNSSNSYYNDRT